MPRSRQRVCLQDGLKLDLSRLTRQRLIQPGASTGPLGIEWTREGERFASGLITADMSDPVEGSFRIQLGNIDQRIALISQPRHFGGRQWYFVCPYMNRRASVLWKPPGAKFFACRQEWGRQVAYRTQFMCSSDRAHHVKRRLCDRIGGAGSHEEWEVPPKPKWMRWRTYARLEARIDAQDANLDRELNLVAARFLRRWGDGV
jgi:hypothetical protein